MLNRLDIHNFQSLKDVHLELGLLTVIVGESNSGKSAVGRALKALASNIRGSASITMGCKSASVSASSDDFKVTLEKSDTSSCYRLSQTGQQDKEYTKLAGETPDEITKILGLEPLKDGLSINFAGQHDSPFLLTSPGASVARILGDLTNVITVFEAVREANRRRSTANSELKLRKRDHKEVSEKLVAFEALKVRAEALKLAEVALNEVGTLEAQIEELNKALESITRLSDYLEVPPEVDITELLEVYEAFKSVYDLADRAGKARSIVVESTLAVVKHTNDHKRAEDALHGLLKENGVCPVCQSMIQ